LSHTISELKRAVKVALLDRPRRALGKRAAFGLPLRQAAVEHRHLVMAEDAEHPPGARRRIEPVAVVDDHVLAVADAHLAHARGEFLRRRQHVGQGIVGVGDLVDVEEERARDVLGEVFRAGVAL
jgi:hypothetical protein